jgi:hypothetical protein
MLATKVHVSSSTPPSTSVPTPTKSDGRRHHSEHRHNPRHVTSRRSIDWKLGGSVFYPLYTRLDFILEGCAHDEGRNSHGDLPHCSPSDFILERDLSGERVFFSPLCKLAEVISKLVGVHVRLLRWLCLLFLSGLSSTNSLDTLK